MNPRALAAQVVASVLNGEGSLASRLPPALERAGRDRALVQELCYGTLRWRWRLEAASKPLLRKPFKEKDQDVTALLMIGLYQLLYLRVPDHAAVGETVAAAKALKKPWATALLNAVLRNFQRRRDELLAAADRDDATRLSHPRWLLNALTKAYPEDWRRIAEANNAHPPMTLRVAARTDRDAYLERLSAAGIAARPAPHTPQGVVLEQALEVEKLPGFATGEVSVQDGAAQLAAQLLEVAPGQLILDACAAPGGKTGHLWELAPEAEIVALDSDPLRLERVEENLERLGGQVAVVAADAADTAAWWDGRPFARILLDAPCSASGVIRRHPDIKSLRMPWDIPPLATTQEALLEALWPLLAPGGILLYATCSVLPEENEAVVGAFLARHPEAREVTIEATWGRAARHGRQLLPGDDGMDGFYYAKLEKN